jgi:protein associated with RNAse G/E
MTSGQLITVQSCKYDGRVNRSWRVRLKRREGPLVVVEGVFEEEVRHPLLGHIVEGTRSTEYFWADRWYSVFRFREPSGALRNFYCNLNMPPTFEKDFIKFVDLDIDVLVTPDLSYRILDEDEFELHAEKYRYPPDVRRRAFEALAEVIGLIERRQFPFDAGTASENL